MPARVNTTGDIGNAPDASDSYDKDNIFLSPEGWVYRHYKKDDLSAYWDEILVAGEVDAAATIGTVANAPLTEIGATDETNFEVGDGTKDFENSPLYVSNAPANAGGGGGEGGGE